MASSVNCAVERTCEQVRISQRPLPFHFQNVRVALRVFDLSTKSLEAEAADRGDRPYCFRLRGFAESVREV